MSGLGKNLLYMSLKVPEKMTEELGGAFLRIYL
jgi:hypothetical protein